MARHFRGYFLSDIRSNHAIEIHLRDTTTELCRRSSPRRAFYWLLRLRSDCSKR